MFWGQNVSYIKVIGFKIRNYTGAGIQFNTTGTNSVQSHIEIRDNEVYNGAYANNDSWAISVHAWPWGSTTNSISDIIIDGNYIHDVDTATTEGNETLTISFAVNRLQITNNILESHNFIGIDVLGKLPSQYPNGVIISGNTVKNNRGTKDAISAIYIDGAKNVTIENNAVYNNRGVGIDPSVEQEGFTNENIIVRKNRAWNNTDNFGLGGNYLGTTKNIRMVHNTAVTNITGRKSNVYLSKGTLNIAKNNIFYFDSTGTFNMLKTMPSITTSPNLNYNNYYPASASGLWYWYGDNGSIYNSLSAYQSGTGQDAHSINSDPLFTNIGDFDLTLQADSPAIDAGDFLTTTTSSASGTVIPVADARYFHDGYGISGVSGDTIMVGNNTVTVTDVNYSTNTITVNRIISWNNGDGVSYEFAGSAPDIGAYEHGGSVTPPPPPPPDDANVLQNSDFESGTSPWMFYTNGTGTFLNNVAGPDSAHAGHITITTPGTNVQLYQTGILLEANTSYRLSFKAYSTTGHDIAVVLLKNVSPYTNYGLNQVFNLTTSWDDYSVEFTTTGFTGTANDGRLQFWLATYAAAGDEYFIDDVALVAVPASSDMTPPTVPASLAGTAVSSTQINLDWTASTDNVGVSGYKVYRNGSLVASVATSAYSNIGLLPATKYNYTVSAFDAAGNNSGLSSPVVVATPDSPLPPPPVDTNVLLNSDFESGTSPWMFYTNGTGTFLNNVAGPGSAHAGHITITTPGTNVQFYQTGILLEANTSYRLSFKAYSTTGHDIAVGLLKNISPYTNYGFDQVFNLTTSWDDYSVEFTTAGFAGTANDGRLRFWLAPYAVGGDEYFIDDVVIAAVPKVYINVLQNSDFESGTIPWVFYTNAAGTFLNDAVGPDSARAGHITITEPETNVRLHQIGITLKANTRYRLSFKAFSSTGHDILVRLRNRSQPYINYGLDQKFNLSASWADYGLEFTTGGFAGTVNDGLLQFLFAPYAAKGDEYFIDDVVLGEIFL
jgi:hypothetical protein